MVEAFSLQAVTRRSSPRHSGNSAIPDDAEGLRIRTYVYATLQQIEDSTVSGNTTPATVPNLAW